jgi:pimeloyl-ACP methyl ester carboxylesterase
MNNESALSHHDVSGAEAQRTVTSADGTLIAFDQLGAGTPIIMAGGAFNTRAVTDPLARALFHEATVINYDRRGRGDSGDTSPYAVEREIEDLAALIDHVGGSAALFGYSSGGNLALKAAAAGLSISHLVLYETPFRTAADDPGLPQDFPQQLSELVEAGRRGDAVELYQTVAVRIPPPVVAQMRGAPFRPGLEAIAHTLVYDATIVGDLSLPTELIASINAPALVLCGTGSGPFMRAAAAAVADALPHGWLTELESQGHAIDPEVTAPVVADFLRSATQS